MEFNVAQLLKEAVGATRQYSVAEQVTLPDGGGCSWVQGEVRLLRTDKGVLVFCSLETTAECRCSRCLTPYQQPVRMALEEEYLPTIDMLTGARLPVPDEDTFTLDEHHILDLREAFRQYLLVNLPMQPLCRESCAGICPHCGVDLNRETCACARRPADPRWTPLLKLRASGE